MRLTEEQRRVVEDNRRLALKYARPFRDRPYYDDVVSEAYVGIMHAATVFDPSRDVRFSVVAWRWMRCYAGKFIRGGVPMIRIPEYLWYGTADKRARGRAAVADAARIKDARWSRLGAEADVAACREPSPAEATEHADQLRWLDSAVSRLSERDRDILGRRLSGETLETIAPLYGLSGERVRQIEAEAMAKLRRLAGAIGGAA